MASMSVDAQGNPSHTQNCHVVLQYAKLQLTQVAPTANGSWNKQPPWAWALSLRNGSGLEAPLRLFLSKLIELLQWTAD